MNIQVLNPSLPHRTRNVAPTLVVLHATAGSTARSSINHLRGVGLSYHYIITRDARDSATSAGAQNTTPIIWQCVPVQHHAFHVGSTIPPPSGTGGINKNSVGISLANIQRRNNPEPYPALQLQALDELLAHLRTEHPTLVHLTTHAVVQPWNRADPLGIQGPSLARRHGYQWFQPTAQQINQHRP